MTDITETSLKHGESAMQNGQKYFFADRSRTVKGLYIAVIEMYWIFFKMCETKRGHGDMKYWVRSFLLMLDTDRGHYVLMEVSVVKICEVW